MLETFLASSAMTNPVTVRVASGGLGVAATGAVAAILLIALLVVKELLAAYVQDAPERSPAEKQALENLARATNSAIVPLACVFAVVVLIKILDVL